MTIQYAAKAIYAGLTVFLGAVGGILTGPDIGFTDITQGQWVVIVAAIVAAVGGVLGLQAAPSKISTSTRRL